MKGFKPNISLCLTKSNPMLSSSFHKNLLCTQMMCVQLHRQVSKFAHVEWSLHFCEALHVDHFIGFLWSFAHKHGGNNCSCIFKNTWTRKKVRSHVLLELWRYLHLTLCSFKEDTTILKQGDERICKGINIKAKLKSLKIILHLHQCMAMDYLSFVLKWLGDYSWESWTMFVNMI